MLIRSIQLITSVSILILVHELGHYILAILFKVRVEKFFLFFDPWFSIFKKKIGKTIYGIGWIPLGGYIKISGIINPNDKNNKDNKNYKFYSKSSIKRLLIISGGIIANIILSILIFSLLLFNNGETNLTNKNVPYGIEVDYVGEKIGLKNGDKILYVDETYIRNFNDLTRELLLGNVAIINRKGNIIKLFLYNKKQFFFDRKKINFLLYPRIPVIINHIIKGSEFDKYGLRSNDELISINYKPIIFQDQLKNIFTKNIDKKKFFVIIGINRNGNFIQKKLLFDSNKIEGIFLKNFINMNDIFHIEKKQYSIYDSFIQGIIKTCKVLKNHILLLKNIFNIKTKAYKHVGSFFSIVKEFPSEWDWNIFFNLTATLSIWIAFLNLIPIPSLDGGYILFIMLEMLIGKKINNNIMDFFNIVGFLFMILMMITVIIWDIFKFFFY
ncbi:RIP metalloprotease RseP [Blattabacterium cuenoti]|uniref:RIP metalloprotease RseP n=1 Tax=Blattabacterium cuenoti TaxID=1653831 RepID=UPI00293C02C9|nr:RIP metalloprotease RseP [Blattabacterium cuenoti]